MTEGDRESGRWQGAIESRVSDLERRMGRAEKMSDTVVRLETKQRTKWSVIAALAAMAGAAVFKMWTGK